MVKKILSLAAALCIAIFAVVPALASQNLQPGVYEVDVKMYHAEKEKLSMGNVYLTHTGILKVGKSKTTLTIATAELVSNMKFWYYKNGTTEGETVEVQGKKDVEIGGKTYPLAFEFPVVGNGEYVGVKFAAPIMPVSPSARIKIDYNSAKKAGSSEPSTTASTAPATTQTTSPSTTAQTTAPTTAAAVTQSTSAPTTLQTTAPTTAQTTLQTTTPTTVQTTVSSTAPSTASTTASSVSVSVLQKEDEGKGKVKIAPIIISVAVVAVVAVLLVVSVKLKKRG